MVLEYERAAMRGEPMPRGMNIPDQMAYQGLAYLYARYYDGRIDRESAAKEKRDILKARERGLTSARLTEHSAQFFKTVEWYATDYRKSRTLEAADRLVDAVDGFLRGIPE